MKTNAKASLVTFYVSQYLWVGDFLHASVVIAQEKIALCGVNVKCYTIVTQPIEEQHK